ncbi:hypothetical protein [Roseateles sp. DAIF2]|nr:hypothetical protein [Roseateles sp. DAIF2]
MSKGQRGNKEAKKPKQPKQLEKKAAPRPYVPIVGKRPPGAG